MKVWFLIHHLAFFPHLNIRILKYLLKRFEFDIDCKIQISIQYKNLSLSSKVMVVYVKGLISFIKKFDIQFTLMMELLKF